jgi:hypothetical protein
MGIMKNESSTLIPPVVLEDYADFKGFAKEAAVVVYSPEFFSSPFLDDQKKLRRLTLTALGVQIRGIALTFKYVFDYNELTESSAGSLNDVLDGLRSQGALVQGTVDIEPTFGEALAMRP